MDAEIAIAENLRQADVMRRLRAALDPFWRQHPEMKLQEVIEHVPEARALYEELGDPFRVSSMAGHDVTTV